MMMTRLAVAFGLPFALVACSGEAHPTKNPSKNIEKTVEDAGNTVPREAATGMDGCDSLDLTPPPAGQGVQLFTEMTLEPGTERQTCKLVLAGEDINFNSGDGIFTDGSHHATVWRTSHTDTIPTVNTQGQTLDTMAGPVDCLSSGDFNGTGVITAGHSVLADPKMEAALEHALPDDVAFKIAKNDVLLLNFHMANLTDHVAHACYKQNLPSIPDDQVKQEAGLIFFYNTFITVPAKSTATADMACPVTQDINVVTAVSHMHRRGSGYTATLLDGDPIAGGKEVQKLYQSPEWNEPVADIFNPPLALKAGQWIRWECDYENSEQRDVSQGQATTDEMCMFVGSYWPRNAGWERCGFDGAGRNFGTGTMNGAQFADCWNASTKQLGLYGGGPMDSDRRYAAQRCVTESCPKVAALANDYIYRGKQDVLNATCD